MNSIKSWHIEHILALTYSKDYGLDPRFSLLMFYYSLCPIYGATKMPNSYHCNWTVKRLFSLVLFFIYSFGEELLNIISLHTRTNSINKLHAHVKWEKLILVGYVYTQKCILFGVNGNWYLNIHHSYSKTDSVLSLIMLPPNVIMLSCIQ